MNDESVPWLNTSEATAWVALVTMSEWLQPALDIQLQRDAGITHFEYGVLATLSEAPGRKLPLAKLAPLANSTYSRLSKAVNRFAEQGWVQRQPDPEDGRTTLAILTELGMEKVIATAPGHIRRVRELVFDHLSTEEVEHLGSIADKIATAVGPRGACASKLT